jgi:hypothetical protein
MVIQRIYLATKIGKMSDMRGLMVEWREAYPFPAAKSARYFRDDIGAAPNTVIVDLEFESLADLEKGWDTWNEKAEEMADYFSRMDAMLREPLRSELWYDF